MRLLLAFVLVCALHVLLSTIAWGVPAGLNGDFNGDGIVSHGDYSFLGNDWVVNGADQPAFDEYFTNYGDTASSPSILPFAISSLATMDGNVEWTFTFSNVSGSLAGHLAIRIDGPNAPKIASIVHGPLLMDDGMSPVGVPGKAPSSGFTWLTLTDVDGNPGTPGFPVGAQRNNANEAYAALGTTLGQSFSNSSLVFLKLVTEGQQTTTLRVLGGMNISEYGYGVGTSTTDYFFTSDQVATFTAVPEASPILIWACIATVGAICSAGCG